MHALQDPWKAREGDARRDWDGRSSDGSRPCLAGCLGLRARNPRRMRTCVHACMRARVHACTSYHLVLRMPSRPAVVADQTGFLILISGRNSGLSSAAMSWIYPCAYIHVHATAPRPWAQWLRGGQLPICAEERSSVG